MGGKRARTSSANPAAELAAGVSGATTEPAAKPPQSLNEARLRVMAEVSYIRKRGVMSSYKFVRDTDVIAALRVPMMRNLLILTGPHEIKNRHHEAKATSGGKPMNFSHAEYLFRLVFAPTGECSDIWTVGEGADSLDKSANKSMSAARKYALLLGFNITTGEDPDQFDEEGRYGGGEEEGEHEAEPPKPSQHDHGKKPNAGKAATEKAGEQPAAPPARVLPENGEELARRLSDYEARLVAQRQCEPGELVAHVKALGVAAGYSPEISQWSGPAIAFAVDATKAFDPEKAKADKALAAEAAALASHERDKQQQQPEAPPKQAEAPAAPAATPSANERYTARIERMNACQSRANLDKFRELYTKDSEMSAEQKKKLEECYWSNVKRVEPKKS